MNTGSVYLVGAGCGSFDLITLRGMNLLKKCDTVVYDSLIDERLLDFVPDGAEKISVGKRAGRHSETQESINDLLVKKALEGKNIVRLKGGDPFVFGRGGEEILALRENEIPFGIVPGISSAIAVPELSGIPVTHRKISRSFHVITGHTAEDLLPKNMNAYSHLDGTLVFLMGLKNLSQIAKALIENGKPEETPAAVISNGASPNSRIVRGTLKTITTDVVKSGINAPAAIFIGDTVKFDFLPTINYPLSGISITVTGTKRFADKLSTRLYDLGAEVKRLNYLKITEYRENQLLDEALENIGNYGLIVLTSINGAEIFLKKLRDLKIDIRRLAGIKFAVIGSGTSEILEKSGIFPDLIPEEYTSKSLGKLIAHSTPKQERILILRAEKGSKELTDILTENNIDFDDIKTYDVVCENPKPVEDEITTDFLIFASSSGVNTFFENGYKISDNTRIICIGNITANALKSFSVKDFYVSKQSDIDGIINTIGKAIKNY